MHSTNKFKGIIISLLVLGSMLLLSSCANKEIVTTCLTGHKFGFLGGLLHGFIAPFDLILMLFRNDISVYASNTNGAWYALGFLIGSGGWGFFGGNRASRKRN